MIISLIDVTNIVSVKMYLNESKHYINHLISLNGGINEKVIDKVKDIKINIVKLDLIEIYAVNDLCKYQINKEYKSFIANNVCLEISLIVYTII